jgi:acyl dehydratase
VITVFESPEKLAASIGQVLGTSEWIEIAQDRVDRFADATDDHQWIHVDPERAADGPFGGTIAHGYLTLSLLPSIWRQVYRVDGVRMGLNYGLDTVRFPSPVPVGARVRGTCTLVDVTPVDGGIQTVVSTTVEIEGSDKPACVAQTLGRYYA